MSRRCPIIYISLGVLAAALLSIGAHAQQTELSISRPLDGATVREIVNILVPATCTPFEGFIAYSIDGRFRCALSTKSEDGRFFVYRWDTKALDPDTTLPESQRRVFDGKHTLGVEAYDGSGKRIGDPEQVTVYVKNNASADMPADGLRLKYRHKSGGASEYKFGYKVDLKSIQGATNLAAAVGEGVEGAQGTVKWSVEDVLPDDTALVRQKLVGILKMYQGGRIVPLSGLVAKSAYHIEDESGKIVNVLTSSSSGASAVSIDLPNLPIQRVRIGDTWTQSEKVFRNSLTGEASTFITTSTLEGLEWQSGYPCAKIRSTFSGTARIPFSWVFAQPVPMNGETITYLAYEVGKVVSSATKATVEIEVDSGTVNNLTQVILPQGAGLSPAAPGFGQAGFGGVEGPMGMEGPIAPTYAMPAPGFGTAQTVMVKLEVKQSLELVH